MTYAPMLTCSHIINYIIGVTTNALTWRKKTTATIKNETNMEKIFIDEYFDIQKIALNFFSRIAKKVDYLCKYGYTTQLTQYSKTWIILRILYMMRPVLFIIYSDQCSIHQKHTHTNMYITHTLLRVCLDFSI